MYASRHGICHPTRGYTPIVASDPWEAVEKSRNFKGDIHLLLTYVQMPAMDGLTLAQHVLGGRPHIRVLLMSGRNVSSHLPLVKKPFQIDQLPPPAFCRVHKKGPYSAFCARYF